MDSFNPTNLSVIGYTWELYGSNHTNTPPRTWTQTKGFGDPHAAITPEA